MITTYPDGTQKIIDIENLNEKLISNVEKIVTSKINEILKEGYILTGCSETFIPGLNCYLRTFVFMKKE